MSSTAPTRSVKWVDVSTTDDLRKILAAMGVIRAGRYKRDALGDGSVQGGLKPIAELNDADLAWLSDSDLYGARYLLCENQQG